MSEERLEELNKTLEKAKSWELEIWSGEAERGFVEIGLDDVADVIDSIAFLQDQNKRYCEAIYELKEYLESTIPKMPTNEKPLILTKSLEIVNRALEDD